jgi:hypothetical protein
MMELSMPKNGRKSSHNRLMRTGLMLVAGLGIGFALGKIMDMFPEPEAISPLAAILIVAVVGTGVIASQIWFMMRTDEHDRHAHLWSMTFAWLSLAVVIPSWWILARASVTPPVNALFALGFSAIVATTTWAWMRYR